MGRFGVGERNNEGEMIVDFAAREEMCILNTYFQKGSHTAGDKHSQVDYIICKRNKLKEVQACKAIVGCRECN